MEKPARNLSFNDALKVLAGIGIGISFFWIISSPRSHVKNKMPQKNIKNFHLSPNLRFVRKEKAYHFHHWLIFLIFYLPIMLKKRNLLKYKIINGFLLGSIIQGLGYKDRFKLVYPPEENK